MIVADATPLIHLARTRWLGVLPKLYRNVVVPPTVWREVLEPGARRVETHSLEEASQTWLEVRKVPAKARRASAAYRRGVALGAGEADAIALAETLQVPLLMDDRVAVQFARLRGLEPRWTTSVILEAQGEGILSATEARTAVKDLVHAGLWIRQDVLLRILDALGGRSD